MPPANDEAGNGNDVRMSIREDCDALNLWLIVVRGTAQALNYKVGKQGCDDNQKDPSCRAYFPTRVFHSTPPHVFPVGGLEPR